MEERNSSTPQNQKYRVEYEKRGGKSEWTRGRSSYKYVRWKEINGERFFTACINKFAWTCVFATEREAAIAVDKKLLEKGEEPVNILVRVKKQNT